MLRPARGSYNLRQFDRDGFQGIRQTSASRMIPELNATVNAHLVHLVPTLPELSVEMLRNCFYASRSGSTTRTFLSHRKLELKMSCVRRSIETEIHFMNGRAMHEHSCLWP